MWVMMHSAWSGADVSNDFYFCRLRQLFFFTHRTEQMCWLFPVCVSIERCLFMGPTIVRPVHVALIGLEVLSLKLVFESHFGKIYKSLFFLLHRHQLNRMFHCQRPRVSRCSGSTMELNTYDSFSFSRFAFLQVEFWNLFFLLLFLSADWKLNFACFSPFLPLLRFGGRGARAVTRQMYINGIMDLLTFSRVAVNNTDRKKSDCV